MKVRLISFLFLIGVLTLLNSCSYITHFFILNKSDQDLEVSIEFIYPIEKNISRDSFKYTDEVLKINNKTLEKLDKTQDYKVIDKNTVQLTLPKKSTVFISRQVIRKSDIKSIIINGTPYSKEEIERKISKGCGFHNYYYKIKS